MLNYLIGGLETPYLMISEGDLVETDLESFRNFNGLNSYAIGVLDFDESSLELLDEIITNNFATLEHPRRLANIPALWDLFRVNLTEAQRRFLDLRNASYQSNFEENAYWLVPRKIMFPDTAISWYSGDTLMPIFFGSVDTLGDEYLTGVLEET